MSRLTRYPDPDQPLDHLGNPEDGERRYIEVDVDPKRISPQHAEWIARKRREHAARAELARFKENPPHRPKVSCPRCLADYYEVGMSNGRCAVCIVELQHREQFQLQLEDIHP